MSTQNDLVHLNVARKNVTVKSFITDGFIYFCRVAVGKWLFWEHSYMTYLTECDCV